MNDHGTETGRMHRTEDLRVYLVLGVPIVLITVMLAAFIVSVQPLRGQ